MRIWAGGGGAPRRFPVVGIGVIDGVVEGVGRSKRGRGADEELCLLTRGSGTRRGCRGPVWTYRVTSAVVI